MEIKPFTGIPLDKFSIHYSLAFALIIFTIPTYGQLNIGVSYNSTPVGTNIMLNAGEKIKNHEFGVGLGFNIKRKLNYPGHYENIYPSQTLHYLNLNAYYQRFIFNQWEGISPFLLYDMQAKRSTSQTRFYQTADPISVLGPFTYIENSIGIGFEANISGNWFLRQKFGLSLAFIFGKNEKYTPYANWNDPLFAGYVNTLLNTGVFYRFSEADEKLILNH